nr:hypothetical protein [Tanacetum cinerariifolium]
TLNSKEIKKRSKAKGDDGEELYVRGRTGRRNSRQSRKKSISKSRGGRLKCYIFQSNDHLKRNCPKKNRKKSIGYVKKDEQPSSCGSTYDDSEVMMVMSAQAQALLDWIIDSGCSYHMTPRIFFDFLECDGSSIQLGDNRECNIRGTGTVRIQLRDGSSFVLHNVRVVLSGTRRDKCVYSLDGHAMAGGLNASVEENDSLAQVWHKRLGHMSEARLQLVDNQTGRTVKKTKTDNGLEFCNREFKQLCIESWIARHLTVGDVAREWGSRTSPSRAIEKKTPMKMWLGHPSDYEMLSIFGCVAYPHDKQVTSTNVAFNESVMYKDTLKNSGAGDKSVEELQVKVALQRLNNHTPEEDQTDPEDSDDEDAGDQCDTPKFTTQQNTTLGC